MSTHPSDGSGTNACPHDRASPQRTTTAVPFSSHAPTHADGPPSGPQTADNPSANPAANSAAEVIGINGTFKTIPIGETMWNRNATSGAAASQTSADSATPRASQAAPQRVQVLHGDS